MKNVGMVVEETETMKPLLQPKASVCECQTVVRGVRFLVFLYTYNEDGVFVQQSTGDCELEKYVPVPLRP